MVWRFLYFLLNFFFAIFNVFSRVLNNFFGPVVFCVLLIFVVKCERGGGLSRSDWSRIRPANHRPACRGDSTTIRAGVRQRLEITTDSSAAKVPKISDFCQLLSRAFQRQFRRKLKPHRSTATISTRCIDQ